MCHYGGVLDNGGGYAHVRGDSIWETFLSSSCFCCELQTALNNKIYLNK